LYQSILQGRQFFAEKTCRFPVVIEVADRASGHGEHVVLGRDGVDTGMQGARILAEADGQATITSRFLSYRRRDEQSCSQKHCWKAPVKNPHSSALPHLTSPPIHRQKRYMRKASDQVGAANTHHPDHPLPPCPRLRPSYLKLSCLLRSGSRGHSKPRVLQIRALRSWEPV